MRQIDPRMQVDPLSLYCESEWKVFSSYLANAAFPICFCSEMTCQIIQICQLDFSDAVSYLIAFEASTHIANPIAKLKQLL